MPRDTDGWGNWPKKEPRRPATGPPRKQGAHAVRSDLVGTGVGLCAAGLGKAPPQPLAAG